jgi:dephospho-CoA kinase
MLNVALTGNVASGKSTVVRWFGLWGATIIDSDALVAEVQQPGSAILAAISSEFGASMILPDGSLDRAALRRYVLADEDARSRLNSIVHPAVRAKRDELFEEAVHRGDKIVVNDIPLLFEVLDPRAFDMVVLVESPKSLRHKRLLARGLTSSEADSLIEAQIPSAQKRPFADVVIDNSGTLAQLEEAAKDAWARILSRSVS